MSLSKETIQDLRERLNVIESERVDLENRLEDMESEAANLRSILDRHAPAEPLPKKKQPRRGQGRSDWVKEALELLGLGSPTDVVAMMTEGGYPWDNGVDRNGTVATDLHRLSQAKNGHIKRVKRGQYRYVGPGGAS